MSINTGTAQRRDLLEQRESLEHRLGASRFRPGILGWVVPAVITLLAALMRLQNLSNPHLLIFDETYYAKDAYALLQTGYELNWPDDANDQWLAGNPQPTDEPAYVVHPPLGKWLIALGLHLSPGEVGESAFGWRIASVVAGTLGVLLITLIAQRMFHSVFLGAFAGVLTAVEGHHLVMSRIAMLDIFLMLFILAAFGALLADRYQSRRRLAAYAAAHPERMSYGPWLILRPWQLAAAILLGCAVAVKLSALSFVAVFGIMVVLWDLQARRTAGVRRWVRAGLTRDGLWAVVTVLPLAAATYLVSWTGWLLSRDASYRNWHAENPPDSWWENILPDALRSLWAYHSSATDFHTDLANEHDYASSPWTWLFMGRPVSVHYQSREPGEQWEETGQVCDVAADQTCSSAILDLANPLIWWTGLIALVVVILLWAGRRDWRSGAILSGYVAGYAVWLLFPDRTMFFFYTISFHPFVILAVTMLAALVLRMGTGGTRSERQALRTRQRNTVLVLCFLLLAIAISVFFWPIWTAELIPQEDWQLRIWIDSWL